MKMELMVLLKSGSSYLTERYQLVSMDTFLSSLRKLNVELLKGPYKYIFFSYYALMTFQS